MGTLPKLHKLKCIQRWENTSSPDSASTFIKVQWHKYGDLNHGVLTFVAANYFKLGKWIKSISYLALNNYSVEIITLLTEGWEGSGERKGVIVSDYGIEYITPIRCCHFTFHSGFKAKAKAKKQNPRVSKRCKRKSYHSQMMNPITWES